MVDDLKQGGEERDVPPYLAKSPAAHREEEILEFWNREKIFEKSLDKPSPQGDYIFYDGPPFATGLPHYGHLLQSALKDAIPRYQTMRGFHVERRWGWDCHGLPLENQIEQELGIKTKRDIEKFGIEKFNAAARNAVLRYADDWRRIIPRFGRWIDMENDYRTMDASYTESVWWAFKNLYDRGFIYEGFKSMQLCPRCGTTLSNFEVAQGYKDIDDIAVTVRLPLVDEPQTALLIWTTTPWTLPGNTAVAVNADANYVKVKAGDAYVIVAKDLLEKIPALSSPDIVEEFKGKELVGKRYEPPFAYFKDELHKHKTHAWRVYAAPFVTLTEGTGIVHIAPVFGEDDLTLAQKEKIPLIHHVTDEGKFIATVTDFAHLPVKPKGNPKETDQKIAEWLRVHGLLFTEEKIKHAYPHCWRCETPLLNWAANSWFVSVQKIKNKLISENEKIRWVPRYVGAGRFRKGLETAPDWAISRSRFWGAPLPVWHHSKTKEQKIVSSVNELLSMVRRSGNTYFILRHGEARSNIENFVSSDNVIENHLTEKGKIDIKRSVEQLKREVNIDVIVVSPLARAQETAAIAQATFGLPPSVVMTDERLGERRLGTFSGASLEKWHDEFPSFSDHFVKSPGGAETLMQLRSRVAEFLFDIERRYTNKNILMVTHGDPAWCLARVADRTSLPDLKHLRKQDNYLDKGQYMRLHFVPFPHNANYELDLHRPYIDDIALGDSINGIWQRVPDVFDCWFESGSMPFASNHYPFNDKHSFNPKRLLGLFPKGYPADFIAESIDQTRGWFYSLIVLGVGLFGRSPYKAVVTNGLVLAEDGRKMSKKLKNYPDPMELVERFSADALRYYLLSSSVIRGEDLRFSARGVEEVSKKLLMRLSNVRSFYELYDSKKPSLEISASSVHILDRWILSRLGELIQKTTEGFERYELDAATRPLADFIDDLSTWYLRRSRDRFKTKQVDKDDALKTLRFVLYTLSKVMAPVMPFFAEELFRAMRSADDKESVHLCDWPDILPIDLPLVADMRETRTIASEALHMREKAGIKIRQPLATLKVRMLAIRPELQQLIVEEVNVKSIVEDTVLEEKVWLDTALTLELKEEGLVRDIVRRIQEWRKEQKMQIIDRPTYTLKVFAVEEARIAEKFRAEIIEQAGLGSLEVESQTSDA